MSMTVNYKNWMPKSIVVKVICITIVFLLFFILFGVFGIGVSGVIKTISMIVFALLSLLGLLTSFLVISLYRAFDYKGKRRLSEIIVKGVSEYVTLPEGGKGLDVGCGSGALTIACAKSNPQGEMTGIDKWAKEYRSFSKTLCERNAAAEGVTNTNFMQGDAVKLDFSDESFDMVTSNYVYHNIPVKDKIGLLRETLRVLKKGGSFVIHDIMSQSNYGDIEDFVAELKAEGFERVELIDTDKGMFMSEKEAKFLFLKDSKLLLGKK